MKTRSQLNRMARQIGVSYPESLTSWFLVKEIAGRLFSYFRVKKINGGF